MLRDHGDWITGVCLLTDGMSFMSSGEDCNINIYSSSGEKRLLLRGHSHWINGVLDLPENAGFLSWCMGGTLRLWDNEGQLRNLWHSPDGEIRQVIALEDPDYYFVVSEANVGIVRLCCLPIY